MTSSRSVTSSVVVSVDPATAFRVFTEELDCWWVQGPINFYDSARAYGMRIEPGVGGRIVEVYDNATGEGLDLARITVWEPGTRLAWQSLRDDVEVDVRFVQSDDATDVRVQATIPRGGADRGGTAWVRLTPVCFGGWIIKREYVPREPLPLGRLAIGVHYSKPATAAKWLRDVFGFAPAGNISEADADDEHTWIEFHIGDSSLIVLKQVGGVPEDAPTTHTPWVFVDDLDTQFAQTTERGARVVHDIWQHGARAYEVADLEGHHWTFAQASPLMRRAHESDGRDT
jgi:uncharacterized glyoxalase superfamily protein PhnB